MNLATQANTIIAHSDTCQPLRQACIPYASSSVKTGNIGWFGEEMELPEKKSGGTKKLEFLR